ncbi:hypothetical protein HPE63_15550 [Maribacter arenosus]|uniref:Uncharacterized protein n=2 Tax=Maribacter arenosus TaxID=1854708 RepID=A0ABR7VEN3_9FLAO|nr:hypothetical protein [Maribacter arenosus]
MLKLYSLLLYPLTLIAFFFVGISYAGLVEAGKNQGLAGGAIVFGYGIMAAVIGLVIALFVAYKTNRKTIFWLNIILTVGIVVFYVFYHIKFLERQKVKTLEKQNIEQPTQPTEPTSKTSAATKPLV